MFRTSMDGCTTSGCPEAPEVCLQVGMDARVLTCSPPPAPDPSPWLILIILLCTHAHVTYILLLPHYSTMPQIEVLPDSSAAPAPGWAYVADTGYDPSKVAINPKDRKRVSHRPGGPPTGNELSARQRTAIARRIADLERDNDPKSNIPIPTKSIVFPIGFLFLEQRLIRFTCSRPENPCYQKNHSIK